MYSCWYWLAFTRLLKRFCREVTGFYLVFLNRISLVAWYGCVVSFGCFFFCSFLLQCVLSGHGRRRNVHQQFVVLAAVIGRQFRPTPVSFEEKKRKTDTLAQKIERKKTKAEKKSIRRRKRRRFSGGRGGGSYDRDKSHVSKLTKLLTEPNKRTAWNDSSRDEEQRFLTLLFLFILEE